MSKCPKCDKNVGLKAWLSGTWRFVQCPSCKARLRPSRVIGVLGFIVGPGLALVVGLPLLTRDHPVWGLLICIFAPAFGLWLQTDHNRFTVVGEENQGGSTQSIVTPG